MKTPPHSDQRRPVWIALSELYLDTELDDSHFRYIAATLVASPYSFDQIRAIDQYEVFPVLQGNLISVAGEWAGFDEEWLVAKIEHLIKKDSVITRTITAVVYPVFKVWMSDNWNRLKVAYDQLKRNTEAPSR